MKRIIIGLVCFMLLVGCSSNEVVPINSSTSLEELQTVKTKVADDKEDTLNYQGYINVKTTMSKSDFKNLKSVIVRDITFDKNNNGISVMYRYNKAFDAGTVNVIFRETERGNISNTYEYKSDQFKNFGFEKTATNEYTTKIQYLIMKVKPDVKIEDLKRKVNFTMVYEFKNKEPIEKPVEIEIP